MNLNVILPGRVPYKEALDLQFDLVDKRQKGEIGDTLILLEHPPVITMGRRGESNDILVSREFLEQQGFEVFETNRGGEVTYHGPGQIVGYLIINIAEHGKDIRQFVRNLEQVFIDLLTVEYGITAGRDPEHTGVWAGNEKITAIGIAVKRWVSMHGFAFNVNTNMEHFGLIVPCGIRDKGVTSLEKLTGKQHDLETVQQQVLRHFRRVYGFESAGQ